jgi:hypothetical protein
MCAVAAHEDLGSQSGYLRMIVQWLALRERPIRDKGFRDSGVINRRKAVRGLIHHPADLTMKILITDLLP